jgi:hypothetical protein
MVDADLPLPDTGSYTDLADSLLGDESVILPARSRTYLRVVHHPHDPNQVDTIIPIDELSDPGLSKSSTSTTAAPVSNSDGDFSVIKPWAPFPSRPDFEITWLVAQGMLSEDNAAYLLKGVRGGSPIPADASYIPPLQWCSKSNITISSISEMKLYQERAREYIVGVSVLFSDIDRTDLLLYFSLKQAQSLDHSLTK